MLCLVSLSRRKRGNASASGKLCDVTLKPSPSELMVSDLRMLRTFGSCSLAEVLSFSLTLYTDIPQNNLSRDTSLSVKLDSIPWEPISATVDHVLMTAIFRLFMHLAIHICAESCSNRLSGFRVWGRQDWGQLSAPKPSKLNSKLDLSLDCMVRGIEQFVSSAS